MGRFFKTDRKKETHGRLTLPVRALAGDSSTMMCREKPQPL